MGDISSFGGPSARFGQRLIDTIDFGTGMTVTFFFKVTDTGSWLEIGQSISFFCITSLLLVWSAGICMLGESLMAGTLAKYRVPSVDLRKKGD